MGRSILRLGLAVAGMLVSFGVFAGQASPCSDFATVSAWVAGGGSCVDPVDGDMLFTVVGSPSIPGTTGFSVTETVIDDSYRIVFDFGLDGYAGGGSITYTITSLNSENLAGVSFGTDVGTPPGLPLLACLCTGTEAIKSLFNVGSASPFLTLGSFDGSTSPGTGFTSFGPMSAVTVMDTFFNTSTETVEGNVALAFFQNATNTFTTTTVPEPASIALVGLGLAGLATARRRRKLPA